MEIFSLKDFPLPFETAITIGAFDGIHLGHKALFQETLKIAHTFNLEPIVVTFDPHPRRVIQPHLSFKLLTTLEEKLELIEKEGLQKIAILPFTRALAELSPDLFVEKYLVDYLKARYVIVGFNFRFGRNRSGDTELLKKLGEKYQFQVKIVPPVIIDEKRVSSSLIRDLISKGEVDKASLFLGRPYFLTGKVIKGKGRGKLLGFPTANLSVSKEKLIPARGVYAVFAYLHDKKYKGALNIGFNPTFDERELSLEVHLLNFATSQDLYNQIIRIEFIKYIRSEKKFSSVEELKTQIEKDCHLIEKILT
ncbi:MAG: bifunctional riboflavin kinase/FAD synthetase [Caldimicrobium sp.]